MARLTESEIESAAHAQIRVTVKRILRKYGWPEGKNDESPLGDPRGDSYSPAWSYSPTPFQEQYHRRWRA